jgi:uncharacterized membrane protein
VSLDDWILALHLLAAFVLVGAIVALWVVVLRVRAADRPTTIEPPLRMVPLLQPMTAIGGMGTLVFGVWLAISLDDYDPWDGWILASLVLWLVAAVSGETAGARYKRAGARAAELAKSGDAPDAELTAMARDSRGLAMHALASVAALAILILMIWKPGA